MATIEERIAALEAKLKQERARRQQIEARKRAIESKKRRSEDTRRKILVGGSILALVERGEWPRDKLLVLMDASLSRADDRALFGLPAVGPAVPPGGPRPLDHAQAQAQAQASPLSRYRV
jgi:hypothetical protein